MLFWGLGLGFSGVLGYGSSLKLRFAHLLVVGTGSARATEHLLSLSESMLYLNSKTTKHPGFKDLHKGISLKRHVVEGSSRVYNMYPGTKPLKLDSPNLTS